MSLVEVIIRLCGVTLLLGYLYLKRRQRAPTRRKEGQWPGHGIVIAPISERIQRLRHDYVSGSNPQPNQIYQRMSLLASARRAVASLPYFRNLARGRSAEVELESKTRANN